MTRLARLLVACSVLLFSYSTALGQQPVMYAHFIDVGQGDATLLEFPCGLVLVDVGGERVSPVLDYIDDYFAANPARNRTLDCVIITHDHEDHRRLHG